jgi:hypothetical protein
VKTDECLWAEGPWRVEDFGGGRIEILSPEIISVDRWILAEGKPPSVTSETHRNVVLISGWVYVGRSRETALANSQLAACAPELYTELAAARKALVRGVPCELPVIERIDATLRKARTLPEVRR